MPTDNPKVSAYVPKVLKDRLKEFREEHNNISESQAVIAILAEYFQVPELLGRSRGITTEDKTTLTRIEALEQKFASFAESVEHRLQELEESTKKPSKSQVDQSEPHKEDTDTQQTIDLASEKPTNSKGIQLEIYQAEEVGDGGLLSELPVEVRQISEKNEPASTLLSELPSEPSSELLNEPPIEIKPIPGTKLSDLRFGRGKDTLAGAKKKMSPEKFLEWTRDRDPDKIAWKQVENPTKGYVPADELPGELKSKLLRWIEENIQQ